MTIPSERYRAVIATSKFLADLLDPKKTPGTPFALRSRAALLLRHYPTSYDMVRTADKCPEIWNETKTGA